MSEGKKEAKNVYCDETVEVIKNTYEDEMYRLGERFGIEVGESIGKLVDLFMDEFMDEFLTLLCKRANEKLPDDIKEMTVKDVLNKILEE